MKYFKREEFQCPCCGVEKMDIIFLERLDRARDMAGVPFVVKPPYGSGYRCQKHNAEVGGVENSSHMRGYAVDIHVKTSSDRYKILAGLIIAGFNRIGIGRTFIHADSDPEKPAEVIWHYYGEK